MGETLTDALKTVIAKQAHLDPSVITQDFVLSELGVTSLDLVEIIMTIEDEYRRNYSGGCGRGLEQLQGRRGSRSARALTRSRRT